MISFKSFPVKFDVEKKKNNNLFISKSYEDYIALKDWRESSINVIKRFATITIET